MNFESKSTTLIGRLIGENGDGDQLQSLILHVKLNPFLGSSSMHALGKFVAVMALLGIVGNSGSVQAEETKSGTTIAINGMTCGGCANKVTKKLQAVAGVESVKVNLEAKSAAVVAKSESTPSPRAMWEAIEKAGFTPVKLSGPSGTFTEKPKG